jgi:uncharacterized protein YndB with AHSA1/START domain
MSDHTYVYVIHIAATPEKLWEALTRSEFWEKYFEAWKVESEWTVGAPLRFYTAEGELFSVGEVEAADPPRSLTYTWPEPEGERVQDEPERLTWTIEPSGPGTVKLTLTHERLSDAYYTGVSQGWPAVLSSLKSLLETGVPLALEPQAQPAAAS